MTNAQEFKPIPLPGVLYCDRMTGTWGHTDDLILAADIADEEFEVLSQMSDTARVELFEQREYKVGA